MFIVKLLTLIYAVILMGCTVDIFTDEGLTGKQKIVVVVLIWLVFDSILYLTNDMGL